MPTEHLPEIGMAKIDGCRCRCGHEWRPHTVSERPSVCPVCKTANWDKPKKYERKTAKR